jgi:hypothetical protein
MPGPSAPAPSPGLPNAPAQAAPAPSAPAPAIDKAEQVRGLSCFTGGLLSAVGAWAFAEFVATAAVGGSTWPVSVPLIAAAFVTGCGVGSMSLPAFYALFASPT